MKVLAIGNALVDLIVYLPNDYLLKLLGFPYGSMQLINEKQKLEILELIQSFRKTQAGGGSAANTINALSKLSIKTGFIGTVGKDQLGDYFMHELHNNAITSHISFVDTTTGTAIVMVTPDGERTFATHLGAATLLSEEHLTYEIFSKYSHLHIEGYLVHNYKLIEKAISLAKSLNMFVSFDLSSYNVIEAHIDFIKAILPGNVHLLFANEEEAYVLTEHKPPDSVRMLEAFAPIVVVKASSKGSFITDGSKIFHIPALPVNCTDSTGAGDYYAAGFLFALGQNKSLEECGKTGTLLASKVIQNTGARLNNIQWLDVYQSLKRFQFQFES